MTTPDHPQHDHLNAWALTREEAAALDAAGEHFGSAFLCGHDVPLALRHARGLAAHLERCALRPYDGGVLYPCGGSIWAPCAGILGREEPPVVIDLTSSYVALDLCLCTEAARARVSRESDPVSRSAFDKLAGFCAWVPRGGGWTHSIINYERVLREGLEVTESRVRRLAASAQEPETIGLYEALLVLLVGVRRYFDRITEMLAATAFTDSDLETNRLRLLAALTSGVPFRAADGFFEALLATTLLFALDGSDNLGRFDQYMRPYYEADIDAGRISREQAVEWVGALWAYIDACSGWNVALGGTTRDGDPAYSDMTEVCLQAARGRRRPNLALRLRHDTPDCVWDAALATLASGTGLPALYCEENYQAAIRSAHLNLAIEDGRDFAFGGCTELMVQGCSNVGSLDADLNVLLMLEETLRHNLTTSATFDDLLEAYEKNITQAVSETARRVCRNQWTRAEWHPQLLRTLLIDDCIDRGEEYCAGGARCNWSVINVVGLSNAVDSLMAVKRVVYDQHRASSQEMLAALDSDFAGHESLAALLDAAPRFGNDDPEVDAIAHRLSRFVYREMMRYAPWRGGRFLCGTLMFVTYGWFGRPVGATPDGRKRGAPVGDSAGPVQGRDRSGPTAMLRSVACLSQVDAPGTLVVNMRLAPELLRNAEGRARVRSLVAGYFALGGMQLQINVVDQAVLEAAIADPASHRDLIVRVGGYSEYFHRLDDDLKHTLLQRTIHS